MAQAAARFCFYSYCNLYLKYVSGENLVTSEERIEDWYLTEQCFLFSKFSVVGSDPGLQNMGKLYQKGHHIKHHDSNCSQGTCASRKSLTCKSQGQHERHRHHVHLSITEQTITTAIKDIMDITLIKELQTLSFHVQPL